MRVRGQLVVRVLGDAVVPLPEADSGSTCTVASDRYWRWCSSWWRTSTATAWPSSTDKAGRHRHVDLRMQSVADPAYPRLGDRDDTRDMTGGVTDLVDDLGVDAVDGAAEHASGRLPDDAEDGGADGETDERVGEREAEPDPERAGEHGETGEAVDAGVGAVGDEGSAGDAPARSGCAPARRSRSRGSR